MLPVLLLTAALWGFGALFSVSRRARGLVIAVLFGLVLGGQVLLPDGHVLREATGGSPLPWVLLGGAVVIIGAYVQGLRALRRAAARRVPPAPAAPAPDAGAFTGAELERYARHIMLREVGGPGQRRLKSARVLVIGAGGLGAPAMLYLAAGGVGTIGVIDDDVVDRSNLQRQIIHGETDIGMPKVFSAQAAIQALNPHVALRPYNRRLTPGIATDLFAGYDLILDGCDNIETRYLVNETAVALGKPLVSGSLAQWEGQLSLFDPAVSGPCYRCIFPQAPAPGLVPSCAEAGVIGPLPGVIGAMMALEAIKLLTGAGTVLRGRMLIHDGLYGETRQIGLSPRDDCPVCGHLRRKPA